MFKKTSYFLIVALACATFSGCGVKKVEVKTPIKAPVAEATKPVSTIEGIDLGGLTRLTDENFTIAQEFKNGYAFAMQDNKGGYVDKEGKFKVLYTLDKTDETYTKLKGLTNDLPGNMLYSSKDGLVPAYDTTVKKWGYADVKTGTVVIKAKYDSPTPFNQGLAVCKYDKDATTYMYKYEVINPKGEVVFEPKAAYNGVFNNQGLLLTGDVATTTPGKTQLVDKTGKVVVGNVAEINGGDGRIYDYAINIDMSYTDSLDGSLTLGEFAEPNRKTYFIADNSGKIIYKSKDKLYGYSEGMTAFSTNSKFGFIDIKGKKIIPALYTALSSFTPDGLAWVTKDDKVYSAIDKTGKTVIATQYNEIDNFRNGYAAVKKGENWGIIDKAGKVVLDFKYEFLNSPFKIGDSELVIFKEGAIYGYMDLKGNVVTKPIFTDVYTAEDGVILGGTVKTDGPTLDSHALANNFSYYILAK
ncbi:WG repeat-containing protein [Clostridium estertheticum]|uniref:WG repeat-containing protein n=1 Tax=Clostridium estertheticum TaxID=238834 RepID=UPI0013E96C17|nr:WG repeat-containing protein [Clostridium estertheticum]MBZ9688482.1 WG repeat-containing protein [Clostridium estertheticum]